MANITIMTADAHRKALDELVLIGLAERHDNLWRLSWEGQDRGAEIFLRLPDTDKVLLFGMMHGLGIEEKY